MNVTDYDYCPHCGSAEYSFPIEVWDEEGHKELQCPNCGEPVEWLVLST